MLGTRFSFILLVDGAIPSAMVQIWMPYAGYCPPASAMQIVICTHVIMAIYPKVENQKFQDRFQMAKHLMPGIVIRSYPMYTLHHVGILVCSNYIKICWVENLV